MKYNCECCDYHTNKLSNYNKHDLTAKHKKRILNEKNLKKTQMNYHCETCDFHTSKKTDYKIHTLTAKHIKKTQMNHYETGDFSTKNINDNIPHNLMVKHEKIIKQIKSIIQNDKPKKKTIPLVLKRNVWNKYIGEDIGKTLCFCCKLTDISQMNFSCGHIISEFNGGEIKSDNLKPICVSCNSSMGTKNMDEFIKDYGL